ncbi:transglycosylase SLT domain-containing protein [Streptomyces sp. CB03238]|uniref:aggregation-promoting factor C-terminal-like domain-containing protein n=1 Tax=Streptomyces sp. CB03238 TaxID=1907777 RepID=UPI001F4F05AA|nr:transglycosylase SLT domain-containing protein [Streptomyces sp. CB03238]
MTRRPLSYLSATLLLTFLPLTTVEQHETVKAAPAPTPTASPSPSYSPLASPTPTPEASTLTPTKTPKPSKTPRPTATRSAAPRVSRSATTPRTPIYASPRAYAKSVLSATQYACADAVFTRESNWNPYATNPTSGAYGIAQALPPTKYASAGSDWRTNPITQVRWGLTYMKSRYGSPCGAWAFWQSHHWY